MYPTPEPDDIREMLAISSEIFRMRTDFPRRLEHLLKGLCKVLGASTAAAYELRAIAPGRQQAWPLMELKSGCAAAARRSRLVGATLLNALQVLPLERSAKVVTAAGIPPWALDFLDVRSLRRQSHVLHSQQRIAQTGQIIAIIISRDVSAPPFGPREQLLLDTLWRSHRIVLWEPAARALRPFKASL